jgi:DNA invertase Pin-like site-specific DNA recombinase
MRKGDPKVVVGYIRVSTSEQELGPRAQEATLRAWCERKGCKLVATFVDHVSGATPVDKRPSLLSALAALETHKAGVLLVARRDRLARDVMAAALTERLAERAGATVCSADTQDGDAPEHLLMRRLLDAFAEYERALIRQRTRAALGVKRARGQRVGQVPYGYRPGAAGALEPVADEQRAISRARQLRAQGASLRTIAAVLASEGYRPRGRAWYATTVAGMLKEAA